jgi:hypothetical protein
MGATVFLPVHFVFMSATLREGRLQAVIYMLSFSEQG